jgi:hypothetical protein
MEEITHFFLICEIFIKISIILSNNLNAILVLAIICYIIMYGFILYLIKEILIIKLSVLGEIAFSLK